MIKLTLETARALFKEGGAGKKFALDNYTEEQLTKKEYAKSWKDLKTISGFFITGYVDVEAANKVTAVKGYKDVFATKKQAKSMLAYAQITQLMKEINGDWQPDWNSYKETKYVIIVCNNTIDVFDTMRVREKIYFKTEKIAKDFLNNHKELIKQYYEI